MTDKLARVKTLNVTGVSADSLTKISINTNSKSGTIEYETVVTTDEAATPVLDDERVIQGIKSVVNKTGVQASSAGKTNVVGAYVGDLSLKDYKGLFKDTDQVYYKPYHLSDIISGLKLDSTNVALVGYDVLLESYQFSGHVVDLLDDLAGLIYGEVLYYAQNNMYYITSPDRDVQIGSGGGYIISEIDVKSYSVTDNKDASTRNVAMELIRLVKDLAKLRVQLKNLKATVNTADVKNRQLGGNIEFEFGTKENFQPIPPGFVVDSTQWEEWEYDIESGSVKNPNKTGSKYFKVETTRELKLNESWNGGSYTFLKGKKRGLRTLYGASLLKQLPFDATVGRILFKGYATNLDCLGMMSKAEYDAVRDAHADAGPNDAYETGWQEIYDIEYHTKNVLDGGLVTQVTEPFIKFSLSTAAYDGVVNKLGARATEDNIIEALINLQYGCTGTVKLEYQSINLKYKGALDAHGRLVSEAGQVQMVFIDGAFYAPVEGMDCDFVSLFNDSTATSDSLNQGGLKDLLDIGRIKSELNVAWQDMVTLAKTQQPIAFYSENNGANYPMFLVEAIQPGLNNGNQQVVSSTVIIGAVSSTISIFDSSREPTVPLTLSAYKSPNKVNALLKLKIAVLEDRLTLLKRILKRSDANGPDLTQLVKDILNYEVLLELVKDDSLSVMQRLRIALDSALEAFASAYDRAKLNLYTEVSVTVLTPDVLPHVGQSLSLPVSMSRLGFVITGVSATDFLTTITAKYKPV